MSDLARVWSGGVYSESRGSETEQTRREAGQIARRNAYVFLSLLFFMEVFWFIAHRVVMGEGWSFYRVSDFSLPVFALFVIIAAALSLGGVLFSMQVGIIRRIPVSRLVTRAIYALTIATNLLSVALLTENARYLMGGLTGLTGVVYGVSRSMSLMMMIMTWKEKYRSGVPVIWSISFAISYALTIDGFSIALTLACYIALMFGEIGPKNILMAVALGGISSVLFVLGLRGKFEEVPDYFTPSFLFEWATARMAIASEQAYTYLSGDSILNRPGAYLDIIVRSFENRWAVITGNMFPMNYPRSVSEAFYYDMYNMYDAGSSPGFLLGTIMHGPFAIIVVFLASLLFVQMFYGIRYKLSVIQLLFLAYLTKTIHGNITEYLVIISPVTLALFMFSLACLLEPVGPRTSVARKAFRRKVSA